MQLGALMAFKWPSFVLLLQSEVDTQSVGHIICEKAADLSAAFVLMGNHNKGPLTEFFIGSVTQYVTHHCKKPVVVVRNI